MTAPPFVKSLIGKDNMIGIDLFYLLMYVSAFILGTITGHFATMLRIKPRGLVDENRYYKHRYPVKNGITKSPSGEKIEYHLASLNYGKNWHALTLELDVLGRVEDVYPWLVNELKLSKYS